MAKIPKPIFACFGIKKLCQFWLFQSLPNSATHFGINSGNFHMLMFAIFGNNVHYFILLHISLHCGFWFFHYACQIWQKFTTQFCQFWHNSATHIGINSGSFYMLIFAIFGKNVHYFYTSVYQLTSWVLVFSLCLPNLGKIHKPILPVLA